MDEIARDPILPVVGPVHLCPMLQISKHDAVPCLSCNFKMKRGMEKCLHYYSLQNGNILNIEILFCILTGGFRNLLCVKMRRTMHLQEKVIFAE